MNLSFYSSGINAASQQERINVIANNIANINTTGFKKQEASFQQLMYQNIRPSQQETTIKNGSGAKISQITCEFQPGGAMQTGNIYDFYIPQEGFFAVKMQGENQLLYTRDGGFGPSLQPDGNFYLTHTASGGLVLNSQGNPILIAKGQETFDIGVFTFENKEQLVCKGENLFTTDQAANPPQLSLTAKPMQGKLETSNVDLSQEMSKLIVAQRAYQMNLKMLTVSDEIVQEVNRFR